MQNHILSKAQDCMYRLSLGRSEAMRNTTINIQGMAGQPTTNQVVMGGVTMFNPVCNGNYQNINVVPEKNRVISKWENKRREGQQIEGLYNIRNNKSRLNGEAYNRLYDASKQKVINKPSLNYRFEETTGTFKDMNGNEINTYEEFNNDLALTNFYGIDTNDSNVQNISYNPFLQTSSQNKTSGKPNTRADERLNYYTMERPYMTKGDRIKQSTALAKSDENVQTRMFQQTAWEAMNGIVRAPRKIGTTLGRGVNINIAGDGDVVFNPDELLTNSDVKPIKGSKQQIKSKDGISVQMNESKFRNKSVKNDYRESYKVPEIEDKASVRTFKTPYNVEIDKRKQVEEKFIPRSTDLRSQQHIQQQITNVYYPLINRDAEKIRKNDYERKLHYHDESNMFTKVIEGFRSIVEPFMRTVTGSEPYKRSTTYSDNIQSSNILDDDVIEYLRKHPNLFYTVDRGIKTEYNEQPLKSVPMLELEMNDQIVRSIATRDTNDIKVMLKRTSRIGTEYEIISIPIEEVETTLRKVLQNNPNDRILHLSYEDSLKVCQLALERQECERIRTQAPIHYFQRDFLNSDNKIQYFTNIKKEDFAEKMQHVSVNDELNHINKDIHDLDVISELDIKQIIRDNQMNQSVAKIKTNTDKPDLRKTYRMFNNML